MKILLCEGGDVELGARTSKHILVVAFDPLSLNSLSYIVHCIILFISYISLVFIGVILVFNQGVSNSTSTLI